MDKKNNFLKRILIISLSIVLTIVSGHGQDNLSFYSDFEELTFRRAFESNQLDYFLSIDGSLTEETFHEIGDEFFLLQNQITRRVGRYTSDIDFLRHLFYKVHRKVLKHYQAQSLVSETLRSGEYDCVTGTALYGLILNELGYDFTIRELDYHIFLEIPTDEGKVIIESTDPINGFYTSPNEIPSFRENPRNSDEGKFYQFENFSDSNIGLRELAGLQYYNLAVKHYNDLNFSDAKIAIDKALTLYDSPRIREIGDLINTYSKSRIVALAAPH